MAIRSLADLDDATDVVVPLDVRGWEVRTAADDSKVGSVHDVLIDETGRARYLDVDLGFLQKHVLLPVGQGTVDESSDVIWVHAVDRDSFDDIPRYDHDTAEVTADFEQQVVTGYQRATGPRRYDRVEYGGGVPPRARATVQDDPTVMGTEHVRLRRLSELGDYEVADDDPDPRGWEIVGAAGEPLGEVDDLVVDPQAMKARYLAVDLKDEFVRDDAGDHVLVPVGYARLDENDRRVRVDALRGPTVQSLPRYGDEFDEAYEDRIDRHFTEGFSGEHRYAHPRYDADRLYGTRTIGGARTTTAGDRVCDVRLRR
jgi:photosynthetic reaction center H subunit